nr:MAG TPA: hypothetical protein [Caudoviricetes sp.]
MLPSLNLLCTMSFYIIFTCKDHIINVRIPHLYHLSILYKYGFSRELPRLHL